VSASIIYAGGRIAAGRFTREGWGVGRLAEVLRIATNEPPPAHVLDALVGAWPQVEAPLRETLRVRAGERSESLRGGSRRPRSARSPTCALCLPSW
jgi:hypothetical protein